MHNVRFTDKERSNPIGKPRMILVNKKKESLFSLCSLVTANFQCLFIYVHNNDVRPRAWDFNYLFLCTLALRERQSDSVLLSQGGQLFEELAEDDGTVDGIFHSQRLGLFLLASGTTPCTGPEQGVVQWLASVSHVTEGQLSSVPSPCRAIGVTKDQVSDRWFTALH